MANVHFPSSSIFRKSKIIEPSTPFIICEHGEYIAPVNYFLHERNRNRAVENVKGLKIVDKVSDHTLRAEGYILCNYVNFCELLIKIPEAECQNVLSAKSWHLLVWKELMKSGIWTREFFASGIAEPLSLKQTIRTRVKVVETAWHWMHTEGFISDPRQKVDHGFLRLKVHAIKTYIEGLADNALGSERKSSNYKKRMNPRRMRIITGIEIRALLDATEFGATRLVILLVLFVGLRRAEVADNTLCPGHLYKRHLKFRHLSSPSFRQDTYQLAHCEDDQMIGVMPSIDIAFLPDDNAHERCTYRIIGKGPKIRRVHVPVRLMRLFWHYYLKERRAVLERNDIATENDPAYFLLNRYGRPLSENAISRKILSAKKAAEKALGREILLDVHTLRHTYACTYLEAIIVRSAKRDGKNPDNLTLSDMENYGQGALIVLKENLGHAELATTEKYLAQLASGKLGLQYQRMFEDFIDPIAEYAGK